jgi:hypothetical protein
VLMAETSGKLAVVQTDAAPTDISRMEDVLTSNVWGVLKNCERSVVQSLLAVAYPPITGISGERLDFQFWERFDDRTEPDVIISAGEDVIIVEVKYHSDFDKGCEEQAPQILREIAGARRAFPGRRIHFLGVTREERIAWPSKVCACRDYVETLRTYLDEGLLHELSWSTIYEWLTRMVTAPDGNLNPVSMRFLKDLHEYLKYKEIGYVPASITGRDRPFLHLFPKSEPVMALLDRFGFDIGLNAVDVPDRLALYAALREYIEALVREGYLRKTGNSADIQSIPLDLLFGVDKDELQAWVAFMTFLYSCEYVNLNGKNDVSVKLKFAKGNYTDAAISLFTYYRGPRRMKFRDLR